jgi:cyclic-di-GMP-binding biofilm dispersal mediator protein
MQLTGKTILVVGASGVLGAEISRMLVAEGARVLGSASSVDTAAKIPAEVSLRLVADLRSQQSISAFTNYLAANETIDGLVIAAGCVGFGPATETTADQAASLMQINHLGPAQLISELHPVFSAGTEPFVLAITGVVAERSFPSMAAYCASKQALAGWLASVATEWRKDGVRIIDARPGHTETGLASRALFGIAPAFPLGLSPHRVAQVLVGGILGEAKLLASTDF